MGVIYCFDISSLMKRRALCSLVLTDWVDMLRISAVSFVLNPFDLPEVKYKLCTCGEVSEWPHQ